MIIGKLYNFTDKELEYREKAKKLCYDYNSLVIHVKL